MMRVKTGLKRVDVPAVEASSPSLTSPIVPSLPLSSAVPIHQSQDSTATPVMLGEPPREPEGVTPLMEVTPAPQAKPRDDEASDPLDKASAARSVIRLGEFLVHVNGGGVTIAPVKLGDALDKAISLDSIGFHLPHPTREEEGLQITVSAYGRVETPQPVAADVAAAATTEPTESDTEEEKK